MSERVAAKETPQLLLERQPLYKLRRIRRSVGAGATDPHHCDVAAFLKMNCSEAPSGVYNEFVALRLARLLAAPVADGVLVGGPLGVAFASLEIALPGLTLHRLNPSSVNRFLTRYPGECARLFVFDLWIGNADRSDNVKAALMSSHFDLIAGFDHGQALLGCRDTLVESLAALRHAHEIARRHPLRGVGRPWLDAAIDAVQSCPPSRVVGACQVPILGIGVEPKMQRELGEALLARQRRFDQLVEDACD